jgi:hypothetical protein
MGSNLPFAEKGIIGRSFSAGLAQRAFMAPILPHPIVGDGKSENRPLSS